MKRVFRWLLTGLAIAGSLATGGCVVVPARPVAVVAPAPVWVPGRWGYAHVWVRGYWRYR